MKGQCKKIDSNFQVFPTATKLDMLSYRNVVVLPSRSVSSLG
jgi:hypothetical protein